ncbi:methyltransferase domain protein [Candidatus Endolissoclinum faulkneri L2]|uniref:Methyltransferase domain protein n=1 Tax=Candidatus Endolissoclinum faulkneri L2 TaxID=1193729 RepID=K7YM52_9PROT|nr:methyltransferase domain-containing protein [Candidatus Endolissoclinum faulkneri]AFX98582.1 methyltransferase domain protein [Candidatus Endolissoclinum faulkneri L2]
MNDVIHIFDRSLLRQRRERARKDYGKFAFLEKEIAARLAIRLSDLRPRFPLSLEIGARSGALGSRIRTSGKIDTLIQSDLAVSWATERAIDGPALALDEEFLPFANSSLDAVFSALSLHWVNDLPGTLSQICQVLKPDGLMLVAFFGGNTLAELRESFAQVEVVNTGCFTQRISPFADLSDVSVLTQRAGFKLIVVDLDTITVTYNNALDLMYDLRGMGETNLITKRQRTPLSRTLLSEMIKYYSAHFAREDGRIPASFQILYLTAWAPAKNHFL